MQRRDIIKSLLFGVASAKAIISSAENQDGTNKELPVDSHISFKSKWHLYPDMPWTGDDIWAQRLQDWCIKNGELQCLVHGLDRTVHVLTHQLSNIKKSFSTNLVFRFINKPSEEKENYAGFRLGVKGRFEDYRSAIFTGKGIDVGITRNGFLFIGNVVGEKKVSEKILLEKIRLSLVVTAQQSGGYYAKLNALDKSGNTISTLSSTCLDEKLWQGNMAIVSHCKPETEQGDEPTIAISNFEAAGEKFSFHDQQTFGPVYFAQYTVNNKILKLTAQLAPMDIAGAEALLLVEQNKIWKKIASSPIHPLARTANFRVENWDGTKSFPYKVVYILPLKNNKQKEFSYNGTIAAEPLQKEKVKALAMSCNWDFGFPDNEVAEHAAMHQADMAFFLGDQFYEPNGGFGVQVNTLEKASLDYLRKWYMFGWSYRNLFRHIPMIALPDDHDVYHGNIWGAGGRAGIGKNGAEMQDSGGYKMNAQWVNMAQITQTSHMPDPFNPSPALQNISVYYTSWDYAGISFGIVEDRKFKSPPKEILPEEAKVWNGYAENPAYDKSKLKELEAQLLGERQMIFLDKWKNDWKKNTRFKVLVSASPFCCLQTLPAGTKNDQDTPKLIVPEKGEYVLGDLPTQDMDSNGWPQNRRDETLKLLGNNFHLHLVGDQHLPAVVQYGVEKFEDSAFCFTVPASTNFWPRRWWPPAELNLKPMSGKPAYTGNYLDGFGNKMTVHAVANPGKTGREPAILHDRVSGYGVVEFNKKNEKITLNCWPRFVNPITESGNQFDGWPVTFNRPEIK